jgi:hypothetical protein
MEHGAHDFFIANHFTCSGRTGSAKLMFHELKTMLCPS